MERGIIGGRGVSSWRRVGRRVGDGNVTFSDCVRGSESVSSGVEKCREMSGLRDSDIDTTTAGECPVSELTCSDLRLAACGLGFVMSRLAPGIDGWMAGVIVICGWEQQPGDGVQVSDR